MLSVSDKRNSEKYFGVLPVEVKPMIFSTRGTLCTTGDPWEQGNVAIPNFALGLPHTARLVG